MTVLNSFDGRFEFTCDYCGHSGGAYYNLAEAMEAKRKDNWVSIHTTGNEYIEYCYNCWRERNTI